MKDNIKLFCKQCGKEMIAGNDIQEVKEFDRFTGKEKIVLRFRYYKCPDYDCGYSDRAWHTHEQIAYDVDTGNIRDASFGS